MPVNADFDVLINEGRIYNSVNFVSNDPTMQTTQQEITLGAHTKIFLADLVQAALAYPQGCANISQIEWAVAIGLFKLTQVLDDGGVAAAACGVDPHLTASQTSDHAFDQ